MHEADLQTARDEVSALVRPDGDSNGDIAAKLYLSAHTVKTHINRIFSKTQSRDRAQAILYAQDHGLTSDPREHQ